MTDLTPAIRVQRFKNRKPALWASGNDGRHTFGATLRCGNAETARWVLKLKIEIAGDGGTDR